jgi:deoxyribodipyrimidine photo-lyase
MPCRAPLPAPKKIPAPTKFPDGAALAKLNLLPTKPDWATGLAARWDVSEKAAQQMHCRISSRKISCITRPSATLPAKDTTSHLSPYLAHGQISPAQCWHVVHNAMASGTIPPMAHAQADKFLAEIGWREFAYHLLFHFPETPTRPLYSKFERFPWRKNVKDLRAWQHGMTGYPIVDAGMRQLWQTGWMHNRVRMVAASSTGQAPVAAVAGRGEMVLGHAGRCGSGQQHFRLAMGRGLRRGCRPLFPHFQS